MGGVVGGALKLATGDGLPGSPSSLGLPDPVHDMIKNIGGKKDKAPKPQALVPPPPPSTLGKLV